MSNEPIGNALRVQQQRLLRKARRQSRIYGRHATEELWKYGFLPDKSEMYELDCYAPDSYVSDLQRRICHLNGPYASLLDNKAIFETFFSKSVPTVPIASISVGSKLPQTIPPEGDFFVKPVFGGAGRNAIRVKRDGGAVHLNGRLASNWAIQELFSGDSQYFLVAKTVKQHPMLNNIFSKSLNTVRVLMMRCPLSQQVLIAAAALRIGTSSSSPVDNFSRGGISFFVDLKTGIIGSGKQKNGTEWSAHPETGARVTGLTVPMWREVKDVCSAAFEYSKGLVYVGWDVAITPDGPVLLEGNSNCDVDLVQVHGPLLLDERVKAFYQHYGVLNWRPTRPFARFSIGNIRRMLNVSSGR